MSKQESFLQVVNQGYTFKGEFFQLGVGMLDQQAVAGAAVNLPLKTMNRHGLIAGATGTGKTKTLQVLAEGLSDASIPVVLMDIKGDLSGLAAAGTSGSRIEERMAMLGKKGHPHTTINRRLVQLATPLTRPVRCFSITGNVVSPGFCLI